MRTISKSWEPEDRRYVEGNLQCQWCGNTTGFSIDMKLKHEVALSGSGLIVGLNKDRREKIEKSLSSNIHRIVDKYHETGKEIVKCSNCETAEGVDFQERIIDQCWQMGCPGCWHCGMFIDEEEVKSLCRECIREKHGNIDEDDCSTICPNYDQGLSEVREHYGLDLNELKREEGYFMTK